MALNEDYSSKDFIDVYEELLEIVEASTTKWDPRHSTEADPGVVLLKLIALLEDKHQYRSDMARNQGFLDTVTDKQSAYELLEMLGYIMKQARCATGQITLVPANISSAWEEGTTVTVPRFTIITDSTSTYKFFTTSEVTFDGTTIVNATSSAERNTLVNVQAGEPFQITKEGSSLFSLKDVDEDGRLYLGYSNLAQNGVFVYTAVEDEEGNITETENSWTYIDFSILKPVARWYTIGTSTNNETYIQFPDDFESLIGTSTFTVYGTYTEGSGSNISANVLSTFYDSTYSNYFTVKQSTAFTNGQNSETIAQARENYYNTIDVCNTLVSASDFRAAIKSIVCNLTASNTGFVKGEKYFSNAIVRTAKDRKINTRSVAYGTGYDLFIPDTTEPSDQIDVVGLRNSNTYSESFQRIDTAAEIAQVKADLEDQLEDSTSIDVCINMDESYPRLLAVTTPDLTVRISSYTDTLATTIKSEIINYFQSTYSAGNVTAGEGFDYQTIVDDIKDLNSNILSVSMRDLTYTIYSKFKEVDDVDSVLANDTTLDYQLSTTTVDYDENTGATTTTTTELTKSVDLQIDAAARAVVAGDVPLFRFYNRQNTLTKQLSGYSTLASISDTTDNLESVITVPIAATSYEQVGPVDEDTGVSESYAPEITSLSFLPFDSTGLIAGTGSNYNTTAQYADLLPKSAAATDGSKLYSNFTLATNHLLQIRVPQHTASESYGYGYCYLLYGHKLGVQTTIYITSSLGAGTKLVGTSTSPLTIVGYFEVLDGWTQYETDSSGNVTKITSRGPNSTTTIDGETAYVYNNVTVSLEVAEGGTLTVLKGSVLTADSEISIGSTLNGETYTPLAAADGEEYQIQSGETLVLYKSSNTNTRVEKTGGTWIQPSGFDLYFVTRTATEGTVLGSTSSISFLTDDSCYITDEFVYFLSLRSNQETLEITSESSGAYMLEEGETFIYANQAITEYVELGPGTVLRATNSSGSVTLKNTPYTTLEEVSTSMFNDFASGDSIEAQAYELTTWGEGKGVLLHDSQAIYGTTSASTYMAIPTTFSAPGSNIVEVYSEEVEADSTGAYWATSDDNLLGSYTGSNYEIRLVVRLESDDNGLIEIAYPVELKISTGTGTTEQVVKYSGSDSETSYLVTSTPVSGVFQAVASGSSDTQLLYSPGVTGRISLATADETAVSDGASVSQNAQSVTVTIGDEFLIKTTEELVVRFPIALVTTDKLGMLDCLLRVTIDFDDFKLLKSEEDELVFKIYSKTTGTDDSDNTTYTELRGADVGIYGVDEIPNLTEEARILLYEKGRYGVTLYIHCTEAFDKSIGADDFIYLGVYWRKISSGSNYTESGDYEGITFTFSDLSYIYGFSSELQADSSIDNSIPESEKWLLTYYDTAQNTGRYAEGTTEDKLVDRIQELNVEGRYDYLTMPSETYEHPTISSSYLESNHPYNDAVFPYLYLVSSKIKVIKGR